jgi:hypothetical protein
MRRGRQAVFLAADEGPLAVSRLRSGVSGTMLCTNGLRHRTEVAMGDKSPKATQREKKQKDAAKQQSKKQKDARQQAQSQAPGAKR